MLLSSSSSFTKITQNLLSRHTTTTTHHHHRIITNMINKNRRYNSTLIIAEPSPSPDSTSLSPSTLSTITAATKLHSGPITILSTNPKNYQPLDPNTLPSNVNIIQILNATNVQDDPSPLAESIALAVQKIQSMYSYTHILTSATKFGTNFLPRAAAMMDKSPITDIIDILSDDTFVRPMYAGNALAKVQATEDVKVLSIRPTAFDKASTISTTTDSSSSSSSNNNNNNNSTSTEVTVESIEVDKQTLTEFVSATITESERPELGSANVVVSGGRGLKSGENFQLLESLADKLHGAVGASRAAVDAGYVPNDLQVGQTGKVVAPELYIAVGISGAIQHLSGMKDSKTIVAINNDADAPIFQIADYGLVTDLFKAVPELTEKV